MTVAELLSRFFASYGLVDDTKVAKEEQKVALVVCNPPVIVYNAVQELVALAADGNVPNNRLKLSPLVWKLLVRIRILKQLSGNGSSIRRLSIHSRFFLTTSQLLILTKKELVSQLFAIQHVIKQIRWQINSTQTLRGLEMKLSPYFMS